MLGGYKILARLRAGAMGVLYLARRATPAGFTRPVAIKVIHDHLAANKRFCRMFIDEAKLCARIDDPNVVRVEEFGQADGRFYLVMEYVHGASLAQTIAVLKKRGKIPIEQSVAIAMQIAGGLHGAHEATDEAGVALGIVHRDVSPHNVIVSYKGYVRVIDFGIAKARQVGGQTKTGSLRGKLAYMPPEQARSARTVDRRADLYGVGLILWEMLTFRRVFDADTDIAILNQIRDPKIEPPGSIARGIPTALDDVIMRTLANDPADRPATGAALQRALADAVPGALRVLPGDLAALMKKVQAAADQAATATEDDPSAQYGEEVRGTLMTFGANMNASVAAADGIDTRPSRPDLEEDDPAARLPGPLLAGARLARVPTTRMDQPLPSAQAPGAPRSALHEPPPSSSPQTLLREAPPKASDDKTAMMFEAPIRPATALRPGDGVRPIAPGVPIPAGSSPDVLIPPPPLSSARALIPHVTPSSSHALAPTVSPSSPDFQRSPSAYPSHMPSSGGTTETSAVAAADALAARRKLLIGLGAPVVAALVIAFAVLVGGAGRNDPPVVRPARDAAKAPLPPVTLIAPVVIAPPEPVEPPPDAEVKPVKGGRNR
jgi:serine/threonine-protein kinase